MEVVQAHDRHGVTLGRLHDAPQHLALAVLRLGDPQQVGERRRQVDGSGGDPALGDPGTSREERRAHVDVGPEVPHVGHVAVLPEEVRGRDQRAGRRGVELVRRVREHDQVTGPGRVGHVRRGPAPVRDVAGLGLGEGPVDDLPAFRVTVVVQSFGSLSARNASLIRATVAASSAAATCVKPPPAGSRPARLR